MCLGVLAPSYRGTTDSASTCGSIQTIARIWVLYVDFVCYGSLMLARIALPLAIVLVLNVVSLFARQRLQPVLSVFLVHRFRRGVRVEGSILRLGLLELARAMSAGWI